MISLLQQINKYILVTWYAAIDLVNVFFPSISTRKGHQKQFVFIWQSQQYNLTVLPQGHDNSPALRHNSPHGLSLPQDITVFQNTDIRLIGPREQEVATTLDLLVRYLHVRGWGGNPANSQGLLPQ